MAPFSVNASLKFSLPVWKYWYFEPGIDVGAERVAHAGDALDRPGVVAVAGEDAQARPAPPPA